MTPITLDDAASSALGSTAPQAAAPDPLAAAAEQTLRGNSAALRNSMSQALPVNPDEDAQTRRYAAAINVPLDTARADPALARQQAQLAAFNTAALERQAPATAAWLTNPDNAKIAHDDIPATAAVEQAVKALAPPAPSTAPSLTSVIGALADGTATGAHELMKGLGSSFNSAASAINLAAGALPVLADKIAGGTTAQDWWFRNMVDPLTASAPALGVDPAASFGQKAAHTAGSLMGMLSQITLSGAAGAGAEAAAATDSAWQVVNAAVEHGVKAMAFPSLSDAVNMGRKVFEETGDPGAAFKAATAQWMATSAMGVVPLSVAGGVATRLATGVVSGAASGELSRQGMNAALPNKMQSPFDWEQVFLSGAAGAVLGGVMGPRGESKSMLPAVRDAVNDTIQSQQTEAQTQRLMDIAKTSAASKLRERDPDAFKQFVKDTADGTDLQGVYIDANKLAETMQQAGVMPDELKQLMPNVANQLDAALGENAPRNGLVQIPIEDFATHIAGSPLEATLMPHLRVAPEGGTAGESQAFQQAQAADMQTRAEQIGAAHESDAAYQASLDRVNTDLQTRLEAIGMKPDIASANAMPLSAFYQVHADRTGMLPHEFAERYPVKFSNEALAGLDQPAYRGTPELLWQNGEVKTDEATDLPLNADGTVTLYHHTSVEKAAQIRATGKLKSAAEPDVYLTTRAETDTGYGDSAVAVHVDPATLAIDDEFPNGRRDFRIDTGKPGGSVKVQVANEAEAPTLKQDARGTYSPSAKTISVLKGADLSTFQHELGHFFLDTLGHLAADPAAPASVKADMATLLKWGGHSDITDWHRMSLDEQRGLHEKFATGWETYLMKGEAPTLEMRSLFSRFRSWMVNVYKSMKGSPGDFTPEVRGVFDRMIASEDAIHEAELARKYMPLFDSPEKSGMTPEEWSAYQATGKDATETAIEGLIGKTMKDMAWMDRLRTASLKSVQKDAAEKRKIVTREVRAEVMSQPVYRAWSFLTGKDTAALPDEVNAEHVQAVRDWTEKRTEHEADTKSTARAAAWEASPESKQEHKNNGLAKGQWLAKNRARVDLDIKREMLDYDEQNPKPVAPDKKTIGSTDPTTGAGKLNTGALKALAPDAVEALRGLRMTSAKGMEPGIVADMFGFPDAESLVKALTQTEPPRSVVEGMTDQRMLERHGEIANSEAMARTADELVHNEVRARFVATELRALKKATGPVRDMVAAAKEVAANTIDTKRIRDIGERQFNAAETRSAAQAEKAMGKGDTEGAAIAKRDQLLNMELARAARDAKEYVVKALDYLKKFDKPSVREAIDLDYRDQIDALLDRADLRKSVSGADLDKREALQSFVERMAGAGYKPQIPESLLNEAQRWHYKDMPLVAFRGLVDSVKSIEHLGKLKTKLRDGQETRAINDLADEVKASAAKLPQRPAESNRGLTRMKSAWVKTKSFGRSAQAAMLKMEQMFDWLDARNPNGALNRVVFRRLSEAGVHENNLLTRVKGDIDALVTSHLADVTKERGRVYQADGLIDGATGLPQKFTTKEMLMLAGNMGNESNAAKMAKGEKWDQPAVWDFLHKNMTKAHWDFVAGMGKTLESLWPEKLAMDRRLGNTSPEKIAPRAFDTPHGRYDGWYWPLMYDPARAQDVAERGARQGDAMFENIYSKANTDTGRMNTRNENYARPLLLDLDALPRMIKDEIHDISHREAVIDADRFLSHPTVRKAIVESLSQEHYDQLRPWLQSIANDGKTSTDGARGMEFFNTIAREARTRATIVGLGFRVTTALVHGMSAGAESVSELGAKWMGSGLKDFANPAQWSSNKDFIFERSGEMRNRMNEVDRDVREHLREIDTRLMDPTSGAVARGADLMKAHAYSMIAGLDMASALPTWMGAYKKAMTPIERGGLGLGEQDAVYFADKTVRNAHGGTGIKDLARVQRGTEFQKLFTMFYTFWNHNINRIVDTSKLVTSPQHRALMKEANHWTDTQLASTVIMRTLVYTIGVQALHALVHPPKKEDDGEHWTVWAAKELAASAFAGIPIARDISAHYLTGRSYSATPAASMVDAVGRTGQDVANALTGKEVSDKWLKHTINTAGYVFGLPTGQLSSGAQFLWDVGDGKQHPDSAKDWWNGLLHGDMKQH